MGLIGSGRRRLLEALAASLVTLLPILAAGVQDGTRGVDAFWSAQTRPAFAAEGDPFVWAVGGAGPDEARHLAVDSAGNVYLAGMFSATMDADPGQGTVSLTSLGSTDILLAKYGPGGADVLLLKITSAGDLAWARSIGGTEHAAPGTGGLALDRAGNVLLTGTFDGVLDVSGDGAITLETRGPG